MIRQGHIGRAEAILLLWFAIAAKVLLTLPASLMSDGLTAGWLIALGGAVFACVGVLPGLALARRFGRVPLARVADEAAGLIGGKIFSFLITLFFMGLISLVLREFAEAFVIAILPRTPVRVVTIVFVLAVAYCAYLGLETMGRLSVLLTPWLLILLGLVLFGELGDFSLERLYPLWGRGPADVLVSSLLRSSIYSDILVLGVMYPYLRELRDLPSVAVWGIGLSAVVIVGVQVVITAIFDVLGSDQLAFPIIHLARMVSFGRFLSRIEAVVVFLWILAAALSLTALLWATATNLAEALRLPDHRPLIVPLTAIAIASSLWFTDLTQVATIDFEYFRRWTWTLAYALPLVLWLLAAIRKKRGQPAGAGGEPADESGAKSAGDAASEPADGGVPSES